VSNETRITSHASVENLHKKLEPGTKKKKLRINFTPSIKEYEKPHAVSNTISRSMSQISIESPYTKYRPEYRRAEDVYGIRNPYS